MCIKNFFNLLLTRRGGLCIIGFAFEKRAPSGCGSAWLECLIWDQEVAGSNPVTPIGFSNE